MLKPFDLDAYLNRVKLTNTPSVDIEGLHQLHQAQAFTIPFENLDILLGRGISLNPDAIFEKLVLNHRGGYCFELNGLLLQVLNNLGFTARPLLARVHLRGTPTGRTHQLNCVELDGRQWIIDVGFGAGGARSPMLLEPNYTTQTDYFSYRLLEDPYWGWMLQTLEGEEWKNTYSFDMMPVTPEDLLLSNFYTSHSPDMQFTHVKVVSKPFHEGRVSLRDTTLTTLEKDVRAELEIPEGQEYLDTLKNIFGVEVNADYGDFKG